MVALQFYSAAQLISAAKGRGSADPGRCPRAGRTQGLRPGNLRVTTPT